ncbi:hypothetical protein SAMN05421505_109201 [Sinosporangium album]|uniref:Uncharacterized protein n=1 Tax=Sinosporangium album TaxID=504805 RepID=A0A1G7YCN0_9ACTN|nr:hypothetical protein [Sinosporangium album]SDG94308.1 hypothetical protein SAMN05421505_109201 [Sinosporangium album]
MFESGKYIAYANLATGTAATAVVWSALPIVGRLYFHQYDTGGLEAGAKTWGTSSDDIDEGSGALVDLVRSMAEPDWSGDSRMAFQQWVDNFADDFRADRLLAKTTGAVLYASAALLYAFIVYNSTLVMRIALIAKRVIAASLAGPPTFFLAQAAASMEVAKLYAELIKQEARSDTVMHGLTGALGAVLAATVAHDTATGSGEGLRDLSQATVTQLPLIAWGAANRFERDVTADAISGTGRAGRFSLLQGLAVPKGLTDVFGQSYLLTGQVVPEQREDGTYGL